MLRYLWQSHLFFVRNSWIIRTQLTRFEYMRGYAPAYFRFMQLELKSYLAGEKVF